MALICRMLTEEEFAHGRLEANYATGSSAAKEH